MKERRTLSEVRARDTFVLGSTTAWEPSGKVGTRPRTRTDMIANCLAASRSGTALWRVFPSSRSSADIGRMERKPPPMHTRPASLGGKVPLRGRTTVPPFPKLLDVAKNHTPSAMSLYKCRFSLRSVRSMVTVLLINAENDQASYCTSLHHPASSLSNFLPETCRLVCSRRILGSRRSKVAKRSRHRRI